MNEEIIDMEEERLFNAWDKEMEQWLKSWPAERAYKAYVNQKKDSDTSK